MHARAATLASLLVCLLVGAPQAQVETAVLTTPLNGATSVDTSVPFAWTPGQIELAVTVKKIVGS